MLNYEEIKDMEMDEIAKRCYVEIGVPEYAYEESISYANSLKAFMVYYGIMFEYNSTLFDIVENVIGYFADNSLLPVGEIAEIIPEVSYDEVHAFFGWMEKEEN